MTPDERREAEIGRWYLQAFMCRFRSDNLPRPGSAVFGSRFVLMEEQEDGSLVKWAPPKGRG